MPFLPPVFLRWRHHHHKAQGFTIIELMVTVSVAAIILALAIPSFQSSIASNRLMTATNQIVAALNQAKSEALRRNARAVLCRDNGNGQCNADAGPWDNGWIVFVDTTPVNPPAIADADTIIARGAAHGDIAPRGKNTTTKAATAYIAFAPSGMTRDYATGAQAATTLRVCSTSASLSNDMRARDITIGASGRIALASPSPSVAKECPAP
ncbi:MAG: GspH/FimT family pseudopilin [Pseudomonadota bacterium]